MSEELLIKSVRAHRCLYDLNHPSYDDRSRREQAWQEISYTMKKPVRDCRDKWKRIRDNFRRAQKLRKAKSEHGLKDIKKPKHEQILSFVIPFLRDDHETPELPPVDCAYLSSEGSLEDAVSPGTSSASSALCRPADRSGLEEDKSLPAPAPRRDKLIEFFINLGETVRDFPEDVQIRVKREIFKVVSDAEEFLCKRKMEQPLAPAQEYVKEEPE